MAELVVPVSDHDLVDNVLPTGDEELLVEDDLLVEDVSIDGMCGVY